MASTQRLDKPRVRQAMTEVLMSTATWLELIPAWLTLIPPGISGLKYLRRKFDRPPTG